MSNEQTTAALDAASTKTTSTTANGAKPVTYTNEPNAVTIRITGKAFDNLKEIAAILNKWDDADNTPADIVRKFLCDGGDWLYLDEKKPDASLYPQTLAGSICCAYIDCEDTPQLEAAFKASGFSTQY